MQAETKLSSPRPAPSREWLLHQLYEAAELEHNLMCTYLYAAFSLRDGEAEGLSRDEAEAVARWRSVLMRVAVEEMGHLTAVTNITCALGGAPHFARDNFPLDPGSLPASVVVRLAPFDQAVLQHFVHLERPSCAAEQDGEGFAPELQYLRGSSKRRLTPMALDYQTVGDFYAELSANLQAFADEVGERAAFAGDPALQIAQSEVALAGVEPVRCTKSALSALTLIVEQGEGAPSHSEGSHFQRFAALRQEYEALLAKNPAFRPAHPAAVNPVLRRPMRPEGRVWIEDEEAAATVDLANTGYALMLRLLAHAYAVPRPARDKALAIDLSLSLMRAVTKLGERAARMPAGPAYPACNAGMSFTALRDAGALPPGTSAWRFFKERLAEMSEAAVRLAAADGDARVVAAARLIASVSERAERAFQASSHTAATEPTATPTPATDTAAASAGASAAPAAVGSDGARPTPAVVMGADGVPTPIPSVVEGVDHIEGRGLTLIYEGKRCIHARFCVTGGPNVFLANVPGPWIRPDAMDTEGLVEIAHACPSGAIRYRRKDGHADERPPPVNLIAVREGGPYAVRAEIELDGAPHHFRATLCRCGASKQKPFCDGSHHDVAFAASGEPPTGSADMLPVRDGRLAIDPQVDGPLMVRGNLEITSGTGRVVARVTSARLCRCGASGSKPFCDGSHERIGFRS